MLRSLDCTDWEWFGCPHTSKAQYVRRDHCPNLFILLETVASQDLWIWHAFFSVVGSDNNINVLYQSPLFNNLKTGRAPKIPFVANSGTDTIKTGQNLSKTGQNQAQNRKRGKVNSHKSTEKSNPTKSKPRSQKVNKKKEEGPRLSLSKVLYKDRPRWENDPGKLGAALDSLRAALAVLISEASQKRQHDMNEPALSCSSVEPPYGSSIIISCLTCEVMFCGSSAIVSRAKYARGYAIHQYRHINFLLSPRRFSIKANFALLLNHVVLLSLLIVIDSHLDIKSDHKPGSAGRTSITLDYVHAGGRVHCELWYSSYPSLKALPLP
uniref:Uncharacterized protein n=1 Tax=Tanacetum cinerariifolium TaxID=118510 RepID=A0A6L2L2B3_TANCI|nr:hypothetical protein [Tanacetum cinerariifolium]